MIGVQFRLGHLGVHLLAVGPRRGLLDGLENMLNLEGIFGVLVQIAQCQ